jgi:uncharacterized membrane protein
MDPVKVVRVWRVSHWQLNNPNTCTRNNRSRLINDRNNNLACWCVLSTESCGEDSE